MKDLIYLDNLIVQSQPLPVVPEARVLSREAHPRVRPFAARRNPLTSITSAVPA
jgi:hypothetical protein